MRASENAEIQGLGAMMGARPGALANPLPPRARLALVAGMVAAHAALGWGLLQIDSVRVAVGAFAPIVVDLIAPPAEIPPTPPAPQPRLEAPEPRPVVAVDAPSEQPVFVVPSPPEEPLEPAPAPAPPVPPAPAAPAQPRTIAITQVEYLRPPVLEYPLASRRLGEAGQVNVRVHVDARGLPRETLVLRSSGSQRLDAAALATVRATRFKPYTEDGVALPFWVVMPLVFELAQ